jgi:osmotically inducible protein OsmC
MAVRTATAIWEGTLKGGRGSMNFGSGAFVGAYSFASRFEEGLGTNPEELIGAAHAGCFSMALSAELEKAGFTLTRVDTFATVHLGKIDNKTRITHIDLDCIADVPDINEQEFQKIANATVTGCPVSAALAGVDINLAARLAS